MSKLKEGDLVIADDNNEFIALSELNNGDAIVVDHNWRAEYKNGQDYIPRRINKGDWKRKPEPKYRPYTDQEIIDLMGTEKSVVISKVNGNAYTLNAFATETMNASIYADVKISYSLTALLNKFTHKNGDPFGVKE